LIPDCLRLASWETSLRVWPTWGNKKKKEPQPSSSASEECSYLHFPQYSGIDFCGVRMFPYTAIRVKSKKRKKKKEKEKEL
jgi:hypothetical protein